MNKLSNGEIAIGAPNSSARNEQWNKIAEKEAIDRLGLPEGHTYGKDSSAAKFVQSFIDGAEWQRTQL
jgi:hypothetical protein